MDQPQPLEMEYGIPPYKLKQGQRDACHLTILSQVKSKSVVRGYKGETRTSLMIRNDIQFSIKYYDIRYTVFIKILKYYLSALLEYNEKSNKIVKLFF